MYCPQTVDLIAPRKEHFVNNDASHLIYGEVKTLAL